MTTPDLTQILAIERNAHVSPWARLSFEESLTKEYLCRIIQNDDEIVAYSVLCPVVDELHILNIAVLVMALRKVFMKNGSFKKYQFASGITVFLRVKIPMNVRMRLFIFCRFDGV